MPAFIDLAGQKFHRLTVLRRAKNRGDRTIWECLCDCGNVSFAQSSDLRGEKHRSCGCLHIESVTTHGLCPRGGRTTEYGSWQGMKDRCYNPNKEGVHRYSGRGISVCERWINSFPNFLKDMGLKPSPIHSIDRIDNDGDYTPENCKWSTPKEQAQNRIYTRPPDRDRGPDGRFLPD